MEEYKLNYLKDYSTDDMEAAGDARDTNYYSTDKSGHRWDIGVYFGTVLTSDKETNPEVLLDLYIRLNYDQIEVSWEDGATEEFWGAPVKMPSGYVADVYPDFKDLNVEYDLLDVDTDELMDIVAAADLLGVSKESLNAFILDLAKEKFDEWEDEILDAAIEYKKDDYDPDDYYESLWEELNSSDEAAPEDNLTRSYAAKEGGLKCPYCGSINTIYTGTDQEANPDKDGAGGVGAQYVERHNYECNDCTCKFYTYTETIVLRGTAISQDGIDDNAEASIELDGLADMYDDAADFDIREGRPWDEYKNDWYMDDATDEEIKRESYEVNGLWFEGEEPNSLSDLLSWDSGDASLFVNLSNKLRELHISVIVGRRNRYGEEKSYLSGTKKNLKKFIEWAAANGFQPFYDGEEYWHWENDNDKEEWEFSSVYR